MESSVKSKALTPGKVLTNVVLVLLAVFFIFPLYWIVTGSFKDRIAVNASPPVWFPTEPTLDNYIRLFENPALRWLGNTVFMAVVAMALTCITAAMAGYVLAKKRFPGRKLIFSIMICAMALPKQVILIPLLKEMSFLHLHDSLWAVIFPTVGWPFGIFLMKQFSETIPGEMIEAARIDGAGECAPHRRGAAHGHPRYRRAGHLYLHQQLERLLPAVDHAELQQQPDHLPGHCKIQAEMSNDFGLIMAGAALAAIPIIAVFLMFQKYFTQGIAMGAVKG